MEGSALANPTRRQASGADTALSNAVTSVTVSQQESEGQASEPAAGSTGEPQSPRAARSQVSTAVSFEGARAAGSAVQPERSVDEDSALSAAEPDGPVRSNRLQQGPRPANSLISTAVHPKIRNTNGGKLTLLSQQNHPAQQHQPQTHQQAHQLPQQLLQQQQQQRYALPAVPSRAPYGRGAGLTVDHYASSPEVQRPHSITSQAVETRAEGHGHAGRSAEEQGEAPGRGLRTQPTRSNARAATPASVYGQIQAPRGPPGPPSPRKDRQHSLQWPNAVGGGGSGAGGMDPATAAAAAAAAFLGNGLVGGWGLMQGLGQGSPSIAAAGHSQPALPHALLAAASPFNLAALLWQPSEQADSVPGALALPPPTQGATLQAAAPVPPTQTGHEKREQRLLQPHQQQLLQSQKPPDAVAAVGGGGSSNPQDAGESGRGGGAGVDRGGTVTVGGGNHGQQPSVSPSQDCGASRHRLRQGRPSYGVPAAALLESMYGGAQPGVNPFALADMHGLQGLLMSASMSAAAAAAAAAGGTGGPADDGVGIGVQPGAVRVKPEQQQQHTRGSSQVGPGPQHLLAHPRVAALNTNVMQVHQQENHHAQQPVGDLHQHQQEALLFPGRGYGHGSQHGEVLGTGAAAAAVVAAASSEAGRSGSGAVDAIAMAAHQAMAAAEPVVTTTATSACGGGNGTVVEGGIGAAVASPDPGIAAPHPAMQLYVPVMLPLELVSAHMAINQAAAAAAAVAGAATQAASPVDAGAVIPAVAGCGGDKVIGGAATDGRGVGGGGGTGGSRDPLMGNADGGATTVHSTQAPNTIQQRFLKFDHESAQQNAAGGSVGRCSDGNGDGEGAPCAATSVARGAGANGGYAPSGGGTAVPAASGHAPRGAADDSLGVMAGDGAGASTAATPLGNGASLALSQHSAGSNPGAGGVGSPGPGLLGRAALAAPAASVETVTASVAAPLGPPGADLPPLDAAQVGHTGAATGGGAGGLPTAAAAAPGAGVAGFGGMGLGGNPSQHNHNNNVAINAHSNAYGAGPSMTQTADYRSHLQVALSLLLQATSAAYNSQRQSGIAGANEGSGIFAAAAQQASASNAVGQEVSGDMGGSGAGIRGADGGVGSGNAGDAGVVSSGEGGAIGLDGSGSGAGRLAGGAGGAGAGNGAACLRDAGGGGAMAAAAYSMHVAAMGPVAVAGAEPMDTEGQVVDQAIGASRGLHASPGVVAAADLREVVAGTTPGLADDGGGGGGGGGLSGSPEAYQAPQWSTQRGSGAVGGGGARSAVHGSSGGGGIAGPHGHPAAHHGQAVHHHHNHHHAQGTLQSPAGYHHHRAGGASGSGSGKAGARTEGGCSPGVAQLEGALLLGCGKVAVTTAAVAGASVGSAGGAAGGDGEQADNNSALQMDAEAGHPAASVHATVIAEESDGSEGGGGDDSGSMEVPPAAAGRGLDGGGAATGIGGGIAAGVGSSKAAAPAVVGDIVSQRFEGSRSRSREGQASKRPHDQLMQGPPAAGPGLGEVASHRGEMRSPARHDGGVPDPRDSSMGMAAGPSHDGTDSGSNGATTSDTVDMAEDSRMGSASEHGDSGMGVDPRDLMQMDENLLPLDEHGGENVGTIGIGGVEDVEERGDDNDNAASADGGDGGGDNVDVMDGDLDGDGDRGARMSVGPAAALLGMLGGGGGGASTGHMGPAGPSDGKGSPADKAASHHPDRSDHLRHHQHPATHHHQHLQTVSKEATGCGGDGVGVRASTSGTARNAHHHHHHCGAVAAVAAAVLYGVSAAAAAALAGARDDGDGDALVATAGPGASGAAGGGGPFATAGAAVAGELHDRGSPTPQVPQLQAANSTAMGYMWHHLHGSPRRLGAEVSCEMRAGGAHPHPYLHQLRDDRRPAAAAAAIAGVGPAFSASNADRQNAGGSVFDGGAGVGGTGMANRQSSDMGIDGGTAGPSIVVGVQAGGGGTLPVAMDAVEMPEADMKSSSQEAAGSVRHRRSPSAGLTGQRLSPHHHHRQLQLQQGSQDRPPQQQRVAQRLQSGGRSAPPGDVDGDISPPPPLLIHHNHHHHQPPQPVQLQQQLIGAHTGHLHGVQTFGPALSHSQQMPPHQTQPGGHQHHLAQEAVNANENTTLAALGGGAALHPTSVLTTASQPLPLPPPLIPHAHQLHDGTGGTATAGGGAGPATGQDITQGSAGHGDGLLADRISQEAVPQVTEIHGAFPGMAATAAEALALHQQEEREWLAVVAAAEAEADTAAAVAAAAADAQASWQGEEDHQPSGSPRGPSLSAVMPQFTEVHGAFTRTAGTAAEAQASGLLLRCGASRGAAECGGIGTFAGGAASGGNPGPADPQVGELRRQCTSQAGARLTAPRDAEVVSVSGTLVTAGGGARAGGSANPQQGHEGGTGGDAAPAFHRSRQLQQHAGDVGLSCGLGQQQLHQQQAMTHRMVGTAAAAAGSGGGYAAVAAGASGLQGMAGGNNYTKAESTLHLTPASRAPSRGGGLGLDAWMLRSGRVRGGHDGAAAGPPGVTQADGGGTQDAAPGSVDGHGSNGIAPLEQYLDDDGIATAAVSQSGEVMLLPVVGGDSAMAAGEAVAAVEGQAAAAALQASSRRCDGFAQLNGVGPALSGAASRGGATADGCGATGYGAVTPDTRKLSRHGLASGRGMPTWAHHQASPSQHQQLQSQQQVELQALPAAGDRSGGRGGGHQGQHAHTADGQLSTQAAAYGGFDDEYDSDGERRRAEGPPQPQMTILVTSHAANSHHTVSGGTAVVSEADNGIAGVGPGCGAGSPAVAAWEEEFDGPHRPPGGEAAQQQGSWRGGDGMGGGQAKSAVMSSSRVEPHAYPQHSTPQGRHHYHHHHHYHHPNHSQETPHAFPVRSAVFEEQAAPGLSLAPQQDPQQQQQQSNTYRCAASQLGPQRQRRGIGGGAGDATADAAGAAGETQGGTMEADEGDAAGPIGSTRGGRGASRGRRGARNRTRGEKRKRAPEAADREERRSEDDAGGDGGGGCGVQVDGEKRRVGAGTKPRSGV
ncbi:hypothetical protein Vretimale_8951 [Volvox reticuliferus]|uniref:Uncharacterized protein n=1 Tax=Volvox reticuliferus TaxID=1737510 RepID=A0A8J4GCF0_9CHLO|nr:hypothetical protein Vretifemale_14453 [Volvox reticuliferus]GIM04408.1 hypothetical protein Vretimale_8951 [Volvox reticuliferus]